MIDGIHQGDVREWTPTLADGSVHCMITSIPYWGLRCYQTPPLIWGGDGACEHDWQAKAVPVAHQTDYSTSGLKNDGRPEAARLATNAVGTTTRTSESTSAESSFCSLCGAWRGDLGLEPTPELYIEHMVSIFRDLRRVLRRDGALWLNIGDCYNGSPPRVAYGDQADNSVVERNRGWMRPKVPGLKPKDLCMIPARLALALQADGWWIRSQIVWAKGISFCDSYSGSVMPESCRDRPTSSYEMVYLLTRNERYFYDGDAVREGSSCALPTDANYRARGHSDSRQLGAAVQGGKSGFGDGQFFQTSQRNLRNVWAITPQPMAWEMCTACKRVYSPAEFRRLGVHSDNGREHRVCKGCGEFDSWLSHFATFPERLVAPMIQAGCPHKVCAECGSPWLREVEREQIYDHVTTQARQSEGDPYARQTGAGAGTHDVRHGVSSAVRTLGFRPTCACADHWFERGQYVHDSPTTPGLVIDPFMGSGTVALAAHKFGRRWAGCELNPDYVILAEERIRRATQQQRLAIEV